jgi:primase-polymerase (primpol)-like protein
VTWLDVRADGIPGELRSRDHWLVWRGEIREGRPTKVPYCIACPSQCAAVDDPATWGVFADAVDAQSCSELRLDGIGYVLTLEDRLVGIDLDHCIDPETGVIATWAMDIALRIDSYTEISPSGAGLRIWARGVLPPGRRRKGHIEMYDSGRYLTVTGHRVRGVLA